MVITTRGLTSHPLMNTARREFQSPFHPARLGSFVSAGHNSLLCTPPPHPSSTPSWSPSKVSKLKNSLSRFFPPPSLCLLSTLTSPRPCWSDGDVRGGLASPTTTSKLIRPGAGVRLVQGHGGRGLSSSSPPPPLRSPSALFATAAGHEVGGGQGRSNTPAGRGGRGGATAPTNQQTNEGPEWKTRTQQKRRGGAGKAEGNKARGV